MKLIIHWKYTNLLIDLLDLFIFSKLNKGSIIQDKYFSVNGDSWFILDNPPNLSDIHDNEQKLSKNSQWRGVNSKSNIIIFVNQKYFLGIKNIPIGIKQNNICIISTIQLIGFI